jgi:aspartyl-tRNA(Asn)/glutamyl-tRNA(Gln) amidotransferase subunit A
VTNAYELTATELSAAYGARKLSPVEVLQSVRARVEQLEPLLSACWAIDFAKAMQAAQASEQRWRAGQQLSPIDGIPISIKEMIATRGTPRPVGTAAGDMSPMLDDAPPAARVREAGAVIWGKTTNPDYGMLSSGLSSFHKLARNPWNLELTPGGSSAGAAAAAAAQYGPLHLGTDIGGSLRLPAGWCGIFTLKPSFGRVPIYPPFIGRVAGPMTRTVSDSAMLMRELSRPDRRDFMSLPEAEIDWDDLHLNVRGLRIGLMTQAGCGTPVAPEVKAAIEAAALVFENAGAEIELVQPFMTPDMLDGLDTFWRTRFLAETSHLPPEQYATILPYIREWGEGAAAANKIDVYRGFSQIAVMQEAGLRHFGELDFLISPVAPEPAFPADWPSPSRDPARPFEHIAFTVAYNMTGQPAASINCGFTSDGLPIGMQIVGKRFDDLRVLQLSQFWEKSRRHVMQWPSPEL